MATSRSPVDFLIRTGLKASPPKFRSRFSPGALLIHTTPTGNTAQKADLADGGEHAPDRAEFYPWITAPTDEE